MAPLLITLTASNPSLSGYLLVAWAPLDASLSTMVFLSLPGRYTTYPSSQRTTLTYQVVYLTRLLVYHSVSLPTWEVCDLVIYRRKASPLLPALVRCVNTKASS